MEFYNLTIDGVAPTTGHKLIVFGDIKENLFAATKFLADEQITIIKNSITTHGHVDGLKKDIEFESSILPIVEQLYADGFFDEVFDPNIDTETILKWTTVTYQNQRYTAQIENTNSAVRGRYTAAKLYENQIDTIVNKIAQIHKKVDQTNV